MNDARALQRLGQLADLLDERSADDVGLIGEALVGQRDGERRDVDVKLAERPLTVGEQGAP